MSLSFEIMRNLRYFFTHVLKDARSGNDVGSESIKEAIQWATYCVEVYKSCQGRPLEKQVDEALKKLFSMDLTWSGAEVDISCVKNALSLLRRALLQNPHLSKDDFNVVMKLYNKESDLIDDCRMIARSEVDSHIYDYLLKGILRCEKDATRKKLVEC